MNTLREAAQQALEALRAMNPYPASKEDQRASALAALRAALVQQAEPAQGPEGMVEFLADLQRSRTKYPKNRRMFDGLMGEIDELRRAYAGDGDICAEAFDVAVCAFRIATEGDAGGNARLEQAEPVSADPHTTTLRNLLKCCLSWEPDVCVLGNVTARQAVAALRAALAQQDEPVQEPEGLDWRYTARIGYVVKPYTAPPQRKPLTAQQIDGVIERHVGGSEITDAMYTSMEQFARAVEQASWEKNNG